MIKKSRVCELTTSSNKNQQYTSRVFTRELSCTMQMEEDINESFQTWDPGDNQDQDSWKTQKSKKKMRKKNRNDRNYEAMESSTQRLPSALTTSINRSNSTSNDSMMVENLQYAQDQNDEFVNESSRSIKDLSEILQKSFCEDDILSHRHSLLVNKLLDGENKQTEIKTDDIINAALQTQDNWEQT